MRAGPALPFDDAVAAVARIGAVPSLLKLLCRSTGMGFAAVAHVTETRWTACAVRDEIGFGLRPGGELDVETTLCKEVRATCTPIAFERASGHPLYGDHPTPRRYGFESYVSVPIVLPGGAYFGNLCALDPEPARVAGDEVVGRFRDFAELIALELESEQRIDAAERALRDERSRGEFRERFVAILAHDLRTPLGSIAAATDVLQRARDDPERVRHLAERIARSARRITELVEALLDIARERLGSGMAIVAEPVHDVPAAIGHAIDELQAAHPGRRIAVAVDVARAVPCDRGRLQQLVSNLVGNALVHGAPDAPVLVDAALRGGEFVLAVRNQGEPIPAEALPTLFDPFTRAPGPRATGAAGLGLGLSICRQIVHAHGGSLAVESDPDGTTFTARLPLHAHAAAVPVRAPRVAAALPGLPTAPDSSAA